MITFLRQLGQCLTWFVIVAPWEQAIRVRLGKRVALLTAGFYLRIPFVDRVFKQSVRRRLTNIRPQTLTTRDGRVITCAAALGYSIGDMRKLYDTLESAQDTIESEAATLIARFVGEHDYAECRMGELEKFVSGALDLAQYGLEGQEFYLTSFATARTYRLITGDLPSWNHGGVLSMGEQQQAPS
jgi:hypothetical protein